MSKVLVYKNVLGLINVCIPAEKADLQASLSSTGKDEFVKCHNVAKTYHEENGLQTCVHDKRLAWAQSVADFSNITDDEHQALIECDLPDGNVYHRWIERSALNMDEFFEAATDVAIDGTITYDLEKAKLIKAKKQIEAKADADKATADAAAAAALNAAASSLNVSTMDELKALS